ncbi:MAG: 50S ribosomal protein L28 [Firmicutes bacterium]|jgi:large subunit ribosomal protein L28|nr:50S ribosomal protein L28 [Bacillota bacterium]
MAKVCVICGKSKISGFKVSHSNIKTKRQWKPNIQKIKVMFQGTPRRLNICTHCLKSGKIKRAL